MEKKISASKGCSILVTVLKFIFEYLALIFTKG